MARSKSTRLQTRTNREAWKKRRNPSPSIPIQHQIVKSEQLGLPKVSDRLTQLIEEYKEIAETERALETLLTLATIAWNASVVPPEKRLDRLIETLLSAHSNLDRELRPHSENDTQLPADVPIERFDANLQEELTIGLSLAQKFLARKLELFPDDTRTIIDFWFEDDPERNGRTLKVLSSFQPNARRA